MHWFKLFSQRWQRRWVFFVFLGLTTFGLLWAPGWRSAAIATPAKHYTDLEFPPLAEIQFPDYERYELDNGIVVYLMEDHELPLVTGSATFRTGNRLDPSDKVGLSAIMGDTLRMGGTETYPPTVLNQRLEQRAASVETGVDITSGSASFDALTEDLDEVFALFADVIRYPAFDPDQVDLVKTQYQGSIARRNDSPNDIASREFRKLIYGGDSPYARTIEYTTLNNISRDDLLAFYRASLQPNNMILGIVGDFDSTFMKARVKKYFGDWQVDNTRQMTTKLPDVSQANTGIFFIDQPQLSQSYIQIGHLGGQRDDPDYFALSVLNEVLNGFGGRLFNQIRSRQGLAYLVYAFWAARYDYPGTFIGGGQTASETTVPFIRSFLAEIDQVRTTPITREELDRAKDSVLNSFVFNFQRPVQTLSRLIRYEYYNYPSDFVFRFQRGVEATTIEDVLRAAQTHLKPDQLTTLVVGNAAEIDPPLKSLSDDLEVTPVDITIPEPPTAA